MVWKISMSKCVWKVINRLDNNTRGHSYPQQRSLKKHEACLPVHVDEAVADAMFGRSCWACVQGHRFTAQAQKQDEKHNGSFFLKPLTTKYRQETDILPKAPLFCHPVCLLFHGHWRFICFMQDDSYSHLSLSLNSDGRYPFSIPIFSTFKCFRSSKVLLNRYYTLVNSMSQ